MTYGIAKNRICETHKVLGEMNKYLGLCFLKNNIFSHGQGCAKVI